MIGILFALIWRYAGLRSIDSDTRDLLNGFLVRVPITVDGARLTQLEVESTSLRVNSTRYRAFVVVPREAGAHNPRTRHYDVIA